ncbi:MAG: RND family transporter [Anaerotardibacter sp.]
MRKFIDTVFKGVLTHRKGILVGALILLVMCALCIPQVKINYQFSDYLPESSASTRSLDVMESAFDSQAPGARMSVEGITLSQASQLAKDLETIDGVSSVMWLGSVCDVAIPLEMEDSIVIEPWYNDGAFQYRLAIDYPKAVEAVAAVRDMAEQAGGENVSMAGETVNTALARSSSGAEIQIIMVFAIVVILFLLLVTTSSWFEPVLFLAVIGMSIVYNLGTNIIFGEISFITQMCAAILQLAVSMDYGIVMLHAFRDFRAEGCSSFDAAYKSMYKAAAVIASSAATTFFGFLSLCVMAFLIGADMGLVLAKGILFSFLSVLFILPALILTFEKLLNKTAHRPLLPPFNKFAKACMRLSVPFTLMIALIVVPCYLGQRQVSYVYGASGFVTPGTQAYEETQHLEEKFGAAEQWILLVPEGQKGVEKELAQELESQENISSVASFVTSVSPTIPTEMVPDKSLSSLVSGGYSRFVISTEVEGETEETFALIQTVRDIAEEYYPGQNYLVGSAVTSYDMSLIVSEDSLRVFVASVVAIGLVLLIMFKSISIPLILLLAIESSIWINLAIPYFAGDSIQYIGYLIISAIMLGATIDYTIILTRSYLEKRRSAPKKEAMREAISATALTILTSATILTVCGFIIGCVSTNGVISSLGTLIGRGGLIATLNTFLLLPMLFILFDKIIEKTTLKAHFYREKM